jgi:AcrR family transcriptional regulator
VSSTARASESDITPEPGPAKAASEQAILLATEQLLQEHTLDELSVAQILELAKVSRTTFYVYFTSKDDAFLALLRGVIEELVARFEAVLGDPHRRRPPALREEIGGWLAIGERHLVVIRGAIEEWPRRAELRPVYLAGIRRLADSLERAIDEDRAAGVALPGAASPQLAAGLVWTVERTIYATMNGAEHLSDPALVIEALERALVGSIYGIS